MVSMKFNDESSDAQIGASSLAARGSNILVLHVTSDAWRQRRQRHASIKRSISLFSHAPLGDPQTQRFSMLSLWRTALMTSAWRRCHG